MPAGLTIIEAVKRSNDPAIIGVVQTLAGGNPVLENIRFFDIESRSYPYNRENLLPSVAFRGLNATYTSSTGIINPESETLRPLGGVSDTDRFLIKTDPGVRAAYDTMFIKAIGRTYAAKFFEGDNETTPQEFDGLKLRITGAQLISAGVTDNGIDLNSAAGVDALDEGVRQVSRGNSPNIKIFMSGFQQSRLTVFSRSNTNHQLDWIKNEVGKQIMTWAGHEVVETDMDDDASQTPLLSITEADSADNNNSTASIYVVRFGENRDYVMGIQHADGIEVEDKGAITNATTETTLVEWLCGMAVFHPRAAARVRHFQTT